MSFNPDCLSHFRPALSAPCVNQIFFPGRLMPERICVCGNVIGSMNLKKTCYECREKKEKDKFTKRQKYHRELAKKLAEIGYILVHSCLSSIGDKVAGEFCSCKKFVTKEEARELVSRGSAVDFESRSPLFANRAIVLKHALRTPRASSLEKTHIERAFTSSTEKPRQLTAEELRVFVEQDKMDRALEERVRIDIFGELYDQTLRSLIRVVPAKSMTHLSGSSEMFPLFPCRSVGTNERSAE